MGGDMWEGVRPVSERRTCWQGPTRCGADLRARPDPVCLAVRGLLDWNGRVHSVELLPDDAIGGAVRDQWTALQNAGLPSLGRHTGASNRPHVTVALAGSLRDTAGLAAVLAVLPIPVTLGGFVVFGRSRFVLGRLVVPSPALLALQGAVLAALDDPADPHGTFLVGRWTGHVTLAKRLTSRELAAALDALRGARDLHGALVRARTWDIDAKVETALPAVDSVPSDVP